MDQKLDTYLQNLVNDCLSSPAFASLLPEQKQEVQLKLLNHLNDVILEVTINNLTEDQVRKLENTSPEDPQFASMLEEFASTRLDLAEKINQVLLDKVAQIKQTGQIPS